MKTTIGNIASTIANMLAGKTEKNPSNMVTKIDGTILTITVDLTKSRGFSSSGKSILVASSSGLKPLGGGFLLNLNVTRPPIEGESQASA
jgi:hypothetical protein